MAGIFVLEDQEDSYRLIKHGIDVSHDTIWAKNIAEAKELFAMNTIDLAIVDINLPDGDGFEFCSWIRQNSDNNSIPIFFVSSNQSVESRVTGLMSGGNDYLTKPFHLAEMRARVESKLRFRNAQNLAGSLIKLGGVELNLKSHRVSIDQDDESVEVELTPIEFKILNCLIEEPGKVCNRDDILNRVWGRDVYVYPRSVDTHVSKLRKKLGPKGELITSVHGYGYRFGQITAQKKKNKPDALQSKLPSRAEGL